MKSNIYKFSLLIILMRAIGAPISVYSMDDDYGDSSVPASPTIGSNSVSSSMSIDSLSSSSSSDLSSYQEEIGRLVVDDLFSPWGAEGDDNLFMSERYGETQLMHACACGNVQAVRFLCRLWSFMEKPVDKKNHLGRSALTFALLNAHHGVIPILFEQEEPVDFGENEVTLARRNPALAYLLVDKVSDNIYYFGALSFACEGYVEEAPPSDNDVIDMSSWRQAKKEEAVRLFDAIKNGDVQSVRDFFSRWGDNEDALFNLFKYYHRNPLLFALQCGFPEIVRIMIDVITALNLSGKYRHTFQVDLDHLLIEAAKTCRYEMVELVLSMNIVNIDATDINRWTALMWAVKKNNIDIVRLLLNAGANIHLYNWDGHTASRLADIGGNADLIALFRELLLKRKIESRIALDEALAWTQPKRGALTAGGIIGQIDPRSAS